MLDIGEDIEGVFLEVMVVFFGFLPNICVCICPSRDTGLDVFVSCSNVSVRKKERMQKRSDSVGRCNMILDVLEYNNARVTVRLT